MIVHPTMQTDFGCVTDEVSTVPVVACPVHLHLDVMLQTCGYSLELPFVYTSETAVEEHPDMILGCAPVGGRLHLIRRKVTASLLSPDDRDFCLETSACFGTGQLVE